MNRILITIIKIIIAILSIFSFTYCDEEDVKNEVILSEDATLQYIELNGVKLDVFNAEQTEYEIVLTDEITDIPNISAGVNNKNADLTIIQANELPGTATIIVVSENKLFTNVYTIKFKVIQSKNTIYNLLVARVWEAISLEIPERDYSIEISEQIFFHLDGSFLWLSTKNTIDGTWYLNEDGTKVIINYNSDEILTLNDIFVSEELLSFNYELHDIEDDYTVYITCQEYTGSCTID